MKKLLVLTILSLFVVLGRGSADAQEVSPDGYCIGTLVDAVVKNITVPSGQSCTLKGGQVFGSVTVQPNAWLLAEGTVITGDLVSNGTVILHFGTVVEGDATFTKITGHSGLGASTVLGNLTIYGNSYQVSVGGLYVGGNLTVTENSGGVILAASSIGGSLVCEGNDPAPTGSGNTAGFRPKDQCQDL